MKKLILILIFCLSCQVCYAFDPTRDWGIPVVPVTIKLDDRSIIKGVAVKETFETITIKDAKNDVTIIPKIRIRRISIKHPMEKALIEKIERRQ